MTDAVILWSHALAALLFCLVAAAELRGSGTRRARRPLIAALLATALWALAVAGIGPQDLTARLFESLRNVAWLGVMFGLARRRGPAVLALPYLTVATVMAAGGVLSLAESAYGAAAAEPIFTVTRLGLRMLAAAGALVLLHRLAAGLPREERGGVRVLAGALALIWALDLLLYALAYVARPEALLLIAVRGVATVLIAPLFALAVHRQGEWALRLSRGVAWQSVSLAAAALYLLVMVLASTGIESLAAGHERIAQTALIFGGTAAMLTLVSSPWLRAWAKVMLAKHLFRHRYDYRAEWLRFTDTLGQPDDAAPLSERVVKAMADLTDSPAGLLLVPHEARLEPAARWNWPETGTGGGEAALAGWLESSGRIVELDAVRAGGADPAETAAVPQWMLDGEGWALVPLLHFGRLQGAILLARPPVARALDWEDFDLLRLAGRQVASYLAEGRAQEALGEAQRFDEFNRRFAFILHDIKNLVSQLGLLARNAERHADNPAFRADMIATLQESCGRMNDLLARLSQHHNGRAEPPATLDLSAVAARVAERLRGTHPIVVATSAPVFALADAARLEQALAQLALNAIQASPPAEPVTIAVGEAGGRPLIEVIDHGTGMSPAFIRDKLFKPFLSTKPAGFGIGAFEARQLIAAMGGTLEVESREGAGTRFRLLLPPARPLRAYPLQDAA